MTDPRLPIYLTLLRRAHMRPSRRMIAGVAVAVLACGFLTSCGSAAVGLEEGNLAPDFTVQEVGSDKKVSLADYKGKVVFIDFWATWCGPCKVIEPEIDDMYAKYKSKGFEVMAVSNESMRDLEAFDKTRKPKYPISQDFAGMAFGSFKVRGLPSQFLIGRDGKIVWSQVGAEPGTVTRAIEAAMNG